VRTRDIKTALLKKGFVKYNSHHEMYGLAVDGRKSGIRTRISHGERKADRWLQRQMATQLKLSASEFAGFVECGLTRETYISLMSKRGHIAP
jgi:hypothetical protein